MEYRYFREIHDEYLIRDCDEGSIQRYDAKNHQWVDDDNMAQIYYGGIIAPYITESEANTLIAKM